MLLAWLIVPPSVPRSRTVNCCATATATAAGGGGGDGAVGWVESSQAARLASSPALNTMRFMADLEVQGGGSSSSLGTGGILDLTRRGGVVRASCP